MYFPPPDLPAGPIPGPPGGLYNAPQQQQQQQPQAARRPRPQQRPQRDRLRELKQLMIDRFAHFRLGIQEFLSYNEDRRHTVRQFINIPPNRGPWPGHTRAAPVQSIAAIQGGRRGRRRPGALLARLLRRGDRWEARARRAADRLGGVLRRDFSPARFRLRRVLGFGGFGAAFLLEMRGEDGAVLPVVVKADIRGGGLDVRAVQREKEKFVVSLVISGVDTSTRECVREDFALVGDMTDNV